MCRPEKERETDAELSEREQDRDKGDENRGKKGLITGETIEERKEETEERKRKGCRSE